ncbi:FMN-binding negative transcriptional regulator [Comamonas nitrativorans]|uniref:FMN-binding negative transcriptional regulator n=1 Tax=Comamonas nitrativorans TaxID=108437 RepID=A0ABV9H1J1_9BURK
MYLPAPFAESRPEELQRIMRDHPLAMLVTQRPDGLEADHLPFLFAADQGPLGTLQAHVARANPLWQAVRDGDAVLAVFRGTDGYISPNWYPSKQETHRHVPTWNYEAVHAHGRIWVRDDEKFLRAVLGRLTRVHEADESRPWRMSDAPADYLAELLAQIVGIEIELTRIEGKRKLSQNRDARDFENTAQTLESRGRQALAVAMRRARD